MKLSTIWDKTNNLLKEILRNHTNVSIFFCTIKRNYKETEELLL